LSSRSAPSPSSLVPMTCAPLEFAAHVCPIRIWQGKCVCGMWRSQRNLAQPEGVPYLLRAPALPYWFRLMPSSTGEHWECHFMLELRIAYGIMG
jgi:hypothetical protein